MERVLHAEEGEARSGRCRRAGGDRALRCGRRRSGDARPSSGGGGRAVHPRGDRGPRDPRVPGHLHELGRGAEEPQAQGGDLPEAGQGRGPRRAHRARARPRGGALAPLGAPLGRAGRRLRSRNRPAGAGPDAHHREGRPQRHLRGAPRRRRRAQVLQGGHEALPDRRRPGRGRGRQGRHAGHPLPRLPGARRADRRLLLRRRGLRVGDPGLPGRRQDRALRRQGRAQGPARSPPLAGARPELLRVGAHAPVGRGKLLLRQAAHRRGEPGRPADPGRQGGAGHLRALRRPQADPPSTTDRSRTTSPSSPASSCG
jgi:hypothetical protein